MPSTGHRRRAAGAVAALVLVTATVAVLGPRVDVRAADPPVPGQIAFSRGFPDPSGSSSSSSSSPGPDEPSLFAVIPGRQVDLARVSVAPPTFPSVPLTGGAERDVDEFQPAWSRDGRRLAYAREDPETGTSAIWVADGDGGGARQLTQPPAEGGSIDYEPSWSPDGLRIVFTRARLDVYGNPRELALWTVPADGPPGAAAQLVGSEDVWASQADWSSTDEIAYRQEDYRNESYTSRIISVTPTGSNPTEWTRGPDHAQPAWSPDGRTLAYIDIVPVPSVQRAGFDDPDGGGSLVLVDAPGGAPRVLIGAGTSSGSLADHPAWSPDGASIAYTSWTGEGDIRMVPVAGGAVVDVATGNTDDRHPAWRPTADLRVTLDAPPLRYGQGATVTVTVYNGGPAPARAVRVRIVFPPEFNASSVPPGCVLGAGEAICEFDRVEVDNPQVITITGRPSTFGVVRVTAEAASSTVDLDPSDNTQTRDWDVDGTDLRVTAVDEGSPYLLGSPVTYAVTARWVVGDPVESAAVEVTLPDNVIYDSAVVPEGVSCAATGPRQVRCEVGPLGPTRPVVAIELLATAVALGERSGSARILTRGYDIEPGNDVEPFSTRVVGAELAVDKQAPASAVLGEEFTYDIGVVNGGERDVPGAVLVDEIPPGVEVVAVEDGDADCAVAGTPAALTCALPVLSAGDDGAPPEPVRIRVRVRPTTTGTVVNTACVSVDLGPGEPEIGIAQVFEFCDDATTEVRGADLNVDVSASPVPLRYGQDATVTATVRNVGPATARAATVRVAVSPEFNPATAGPGCDLVGAVATCTLGDLASGDTATVTLTGRPSTFGVVVVSAQARSATADVNPADNDIERRFEVEGTDLAVTAADLGSPYLLGSPVSYEVTVTRTTGDDVTGAAVEITVPANVAFTGTDPPPEGTSCAETTPGLVRCVLGPLGAEGDTSITLVLRGTAIELGERDGVARVVSPVFDFDATNDTDPFTTRVVGAELAVAKQAPSSAVVGQEFAYEIAAVNGGERDVPGATLTDVIPAGLRVVAVESPDDVTCSVAGTPAVLSCALPVLTAPGGDEPPRTVRVRVRVRPTAPGPVVNTACVRVDLGPPDPAPEAVPLRVFESCDEVTTVVNAGDLAVAVVATPATAYVGGRIRATVTVRNAGGATVPAAVRLLLPATACETPVAGACSARTRDVVLGPLVPGASVDVSVTLVPVAAGTAVIRARVLPAAFDATAANDEASATATVRQPVLRVTPAVGPPGFVASVRGTDFPPGAAVRLSWSRGLTLSATPITVDAQGSFTVPLLIAHRDSLLGPRRAVAATAGLAPVRSDDFLVVPATLDPPDFVIRR